MAFGENFKKGTINVAKGALVIGAAILILPYAISPLATSIHASIAAIMPTGVMNPALVA